MHTHIESYSMDQFTEDGLEIAQCLDLVSYLAFAWWLGFALWTLLGCLHLSLNQVMH